LAARQRERPVSPCSGRRRLPRLMNRQRGVAVQDLGFEAGGDLVGARDLLQLLLADDVVERGESVGSARLDDLVTPRLTRPDTSGVRRPPARVPAPPPIRLPPE